MKQSILQLGKPVLRQKTSNITEITDELISNTKKMSMLLHLAKGYGLAAPQIGLSERFFVYNVGSGFKTIINPVICEHSSSLVTMEEGCLSIKGYTFPIERPASVTITGLDINGNELILEVDKLLGRLFQHELDHLNGKLVIDMLEPAELEVFNNSWYKKRGK